MLLSLRRLPLAVMARELRLRYPLLPALMLLALAAAPLELSAASSNVTSAYLSMLLNSNATRNQSVQYLSNTSAADIRARLQFPTSSDIDSGCKSCGVKLPPTKGSLEYKIRIEMIKRQILNKLEMDSEPRITRPKMSIPTPLVNNFLESTPGDGHQNIQPVARKAAQVIVLGTQVASAASKNSRKSRKHMFEFRFSKKIYMKTIASAALWIYRPKKSALQLGDHTLRFDGYKSAPSPPARQVLVKKRLRREDQGWISIDIRGIVSQWVEKALKESTPNNTNYNHTLAVTCPDCALVGTDLVATRGHLRPFITLNLADENRAPRQKRAINCRPGMKECCRQEFYVSFQEMGWNNWILVPRGFNANYCTGSCYGHILPVYHHTEVLQKVALLRKQRELSPCCSPTKMFGLSLIYFDKDENLFHENISNFVVEECGCS